MQIRCLGTGKQLRVSRWQFLWTSLSEQSSVVEYAGSGIEKNSVANVQNQYFEH